jgi:hypothetical protein
MKAAYFSVMGLVRYVLASVLIAVLTVAYAFFTRKQYYPAAIWITNTNSCLLVQLLVYNSLFTV